MNEPHLSVLEIDGLSTWFHTPNGGIVKAVDSISLRVDRGETVALVGESGSGKTACALSILRLIRPPGRIESGCVWFEGTDLLTVTNARMREIRGGRIGMVFQEASLAFDPVLTVGAQIVETLLEHRKYASRKQAASRAVELLRMLDIADPLNRFHSYPHEFSGGMLQRALIALAISCEPTLLIADEPTTSLDSTTQAQVLELLNDLSRQLGAAVLLVTHNFGIVARYAQRAYVMLNGRIVEDGPIGQLYEQPAHEYTRKLWNAAQRFDRGRQSIAGDQNAAAFVGQPVSGV